MVERVFPPSVVIGRSEIASANGLKTCLRRGNMAAERQVRNRKVEESFEKAICIECPANLHAAQDRLPRGLLENVSVTSVSRVFGFRNT